MTGFLDAPVYGSTGYQIQRSLRLRSAASAYLSRIPASAGNNQKWTWSAWVKRGDLLTQTLQMFSSFNSNSDSLCVYWSNNNLIVGSYSFTYLQTSAVFRDPSAWYHIQVVWDTAQATPSDRIIVSVNNVRQTALSQANYPAQNATGTINTATAIYLGAAAGSPQYFYDGYLSDVHFVDGQALTPSSFGQYDAYGNWQAKPYAGSYGTNGFRLKFDNPTSLTTLCADSSGNGNNWTATNVSLTAGASYDSMLDVPLGGGGGERGNYATLNPLNQAGVATPVNGNLYVSQASNGAQVASTFGMASGKWYYEHTMTAVGGGENSAGIGSAPQSGAYVGGFSGQYGYYSNGTKISNGGSASAYGASYTDGDTIGVAYDADTGSLTFYKNGVSQGVAFTGIVGTMFALAATRLAGGQNASTLNFGQRPFTYTPPSGFKPLHTGNLPDPVIWQPNKHFDVLTYLGSAGASQDLIGLQFQPDFSWFKCRQTARHHALFDSVRGANQGLYASLTNTEGTWSGQAFLSSGFRVDRTFSGETNSVSETYAAWLWKAGGAAVTNNAGSISAQVSANTTAGFSIVTYTGTGANATVGHGLGVAPKLVIAKARSVAGDNWQVWHAAFGAAGTSDYLLLNSTAAKGGGGAVDNWNNTAPSSTVFSLGTFNAINRASATNVAYCFAEIPGFSKFGSYTGNGSADGPFVYCGFRPRWILFKRTTSTGGNWGLIDAARSPYNQSQAYLLPNQSSAEASDATVALDFTANGFKVRGTDVGVNGSGDTIIFAAFAEAPIKTALAR